MPHFNIRSCSSYLTGLCLVGCLVHIHVSAKESQGWYACTPDKHGSDMSSQYIGSKGIPTGLQDLVKLAMQDLSNAIGISCDQIQVIEARRVTWRDKSLGCPKPNIGYAQVLVDGALIRLSAQGQVYQYHSGRGRAPFLCSSPSKIAPLPLGSNEA